MAHFAERDNAPNAENPDEHVQQQRRPFRTALPDYTLKPIVQTHERPLYWHRRHRNAVPVNNKEDTGSESSTSQSASVRPPPATSNWRSGNAGTRFGLNDAFARTDESKDFRTSDSAMSANSGVAAAPPGAPESRIPRLKTFSPSSTALAIGPPRNLTAAYAMAEREEREMLPPVDYDSESAGPREGSPSPAPPGRDRWQQARSKEENGRVAGRERSSSDESSQKRQQKDDVSRKPKHYSDAELHAFEEKRRLQAEKDERLWKIRHEGGPILRKDVNKPKGAIMGVTHRLVYDRTKQFPRVYVPIEPQAQPGPMSPEDSQEMKGDSPTSGGHGTDADIPLPSVEVGTSVLEPTPPSSRPASAQPNNESPEKTKIWDADLDFTAQSLQVSTSPLFRLKGTKLDEVRDRESQNSSARAVAMNKLEEIRERNSEERSIVYEFPAETTRNTISKRLKADAPEPYHEKTILEEEGEHIPNTPITIFPKGCYPPKTSNSDRDSNNDGEDHARGDSMEILRRLSRVASASPAPPSREEKNEDKKKDLPEEKTTKPSLWRTEEKPVKPSIFSGNGIDVESRIEKQSEKPDVDSFKRSGLEIDLDVKRRSTASTPPKSDVDPEERITAEAKLFDLPDNKSERNSIRALSQSPPPLDEGNVDDTPRPKADPLSLPTPKVTGAYIDTPAPSARKPKKSRSISPTYEIVDDIKDAPSSSDVNTRNSSQGRSTSRKGRGRRQARTTSSEISKGEVQYRKGRPHLVNSAVPASAVEDLRQLALESQFEDSTLDEFDAMLESEATKAGGQNTAIMNPILDIEYDDRGLPLSRKEQERRLERLVFERMNQHLKNTSSSIRDARQGIERLEHQVSSGSFTASTASGSDQLYITAKLPFPRLWVSTPPTQARSHSGFWGDTNWKFTWLGLILFLFSIWYIAESAMCEVYCHPKQASRNTWQPSDPFFPWAIPTKLDQWTGEVVSTTAGSVWESVEKWIDPEGRRKARARPVHMGAHDWWLGRDGPAPIYRDANSEGSMFNDDII